MGNDILLGDCLEILKAIPSSSANLIYLDPPFFTGRKHFSASRDGTKKYEFEDIWLHSDEYREFLTDRVLACKRIMRDDASIFIHCDHNSSHIVRQILELVFGSENFQSEIIWSYKRWSNAKKGLLQQHQNIFFFSKSKAFKWNKTLVDYSATTNVDQILQKRSRDGRGKAVYAKDELGDVVYGDAKKGVPLGDVWDIPFLNPKAKERTGYPTQKPLLLLERIIELTTDDGDLVIDPFCGSGTTLVAAKLLNRRYIGIDISSDAVNLSLERLAAPIKTESALMKNGVEAYINHDPWVEGHLTGLSFSRVQRNAGADAILKNTIDGQAVFVRVQREGETLSSAVSALRKTVASKGSVVGIVIATENDLFPVVESGIRIVLSPALQVQALVQAPFEATLAVLKRA
jgi:site-specific DNA-methyltransferase (adenine-specific)